MLGSGLDMLKYWKEVGPTSLIPDCVVRGFAATCFFVNAGTTIVDNHPQGFACAVPAVLVCFFYRWYAACTDLRTP